ncbi:MAG: TonB-dependent receptor [Fibrobacteres bacterium]|nr:TonB-dependent receptor [Fibrobacterota bacterium]
MIAWIALAFLATESPDPSDPAATDSLAGLHAGVSTDSARPPSPGEPPRMLDSTRAPSGTVTVRGHKRAAASVGQSERVLSGTALLASRGGSLAEALDRLPGVGSLKTGTVAKPMVNGLHSQRLVVVEDGIRLEGQSWGAEHAVESDPSRAQRVTVVQGGSSVRHGRGAIGGVIVIEPPPTDHQKLSGEWTGSLRSNGPNAGSSLHLSSPFPSLSDWAWAGTIAYRASGDRSAADGVLPNTALREGSWSALLERKGSYLTAQASHGVFWQHQGILASSHVGNLSDLQTALAKGSPPDTASWKWDVGRPDQKVRHDVSRLRLVADAGGWKWSALAGWQTDRRREWDLHRPIDSRLAALDLPEIDYALETTTLDLEADPKWTGMWGWKAGVQGMRQENEYLGRAFVPNFRSQGAGAWSVWTFQQDAWSTDAGARADVQTLDIWRRTGGRVLHWNDLWIAPSLSLGWRWSPRQDLTIRSSLATGWRSPGAVELFADGLHHGVAAIERGDSTLGAEQSATAQVSVSKASNSVQIQGSLWITRIEDFIFLRPDPTPRLTVRGAFPSFSYVSDAAWLSGGDLSATITLAPALEVLVSGSALRARDGDDQPIAFVPSGRLRAGLDWIPLRHSERSFRVGPRVEWIPPTESVPGDYAPAPVQAWLLGMEASGTWNLWNLSMSGANLANATWRDPSDRLRYFAAQSGIDFRLALSRKI